MSSKKSFTKSGKSFNGSSDFNPYILLFGRFLISIIFVVSGIKQIGNFKIMVYNLEQHHIPLAGLALMFAILIEIGGGVSLLLGYRTRYMAVVLIGFLIAANLVFNMDFSDALRQMQFMKDMAILGGLLFVQQMGGGKFSLDFILSRKENA